MGEGKRQDFGTFGGIMKDNNKIKILSFLCNWCSYAGADLAGTSRLQYPPTIRVIRVPCSGRVNPQFIVKALRDGADGVWISGCHPGDCHYQTGNYFARRRFYVMKELLEFIGVESERINFSWVSASEGKKFQEMAIWVTKRVESVSKSKNPLYKEL